VREEQNEEYGEDDTWEPSIREWLDRPGVNETTTAELLTYAIKLDIAKQGRVEQTRVGRVLTKMGWRRRRRHNGVREYFYARRDP
jgi:putative DNA primase/helicase